MHGSGMNVKDFGKLSLIENVSIKQAAHFKHLMLCQFDAWVSLANRVASALHHIFVVVCDGARKQVAGVYTCSVIAGVPDDNSVHVFRGEIVVDHVGESVCSHFFASNGDAPVSHIVYVPPVFPTFVCRACDCVAPESKLCVLNWFGGKSFSHKSSCYSGLAGITGTIIPEIQGQRKLFEAEMLGLPPGTDPLLLQQLLGQQIPPGEELDLLAGR